MQEFDYVRAFSRNIGWVTREEQECLRNKRVAIAGMGGVGGVHLLTMARLGVQHFSLADFDTFEQENFNRQVGATMSTLGKPKLEMLSAMARDINPDIDIRAFPQGVTKANLPQFLEGCDLYIDSLDYFAFDARKATFAACASMGVPAVTAAPFGMSSAMLVFMPGKMTFDEYFRWEGQSAPEMGLRFFIGLAPRMLQQGYLVDPSTINFKEQRGPSTMIACQLCAGMAAAEGLKIMLGRGRVRCAPWGIQYDAYRQKYVKTWLPGGNNHPLQKLKLHLARRSLMRKANAS